MAVLVAWGALTNGRAAVNELALFAGAGGGILGGHLLGWRTVCAVEWNPYAAGVLVARQNDGHLPAFPIWDDVRTFDGRPWRGAVDVVSGGFPCQDISIGGRGDGLDGERSGLWSEMARIVGEVGPRYVLVENSPMLTVRGLGRVLADLAALGFDAEWGVLAASDVGAPHQRERIWIVAHPNGSNEIGRRSPVQMGREPVAREAENHGHAQRTEWPAQSGISILAHGVAHRVEQLTALGNGQVPRVAEAAWHILKT
jgi:DNA (cytosine-5)-methyltransferase 1